MYKASAAAGKNSKCGETLNLDSSEQGLMKKLLMK
jgi:hypothetical protein